MRVGSWPGFGEHHNQFLELFLGGLREAGCEVVSIDAIEDIPESGLDILILHWAEKLFWEARDRWDILKKIYFLITELQRLRPETKVVWLVHNLQPHETRMFKRLVWPFYIRALTYNVDAAMTLSPGTVPVVRTQMRSLRRKPIAWVWHPAYPRQYGGLATSDAARRARDLQTQHYVIGYCGQVRPYKGVEDLIDVFSQSENSDWRLLIAGRVSSPEFERVLVAKAAADCRIQLDLRDMSEIEYESAVLCCDIIVAPFRAYLHSGSLIHALSIGRPVLTPEVPFSSALSKQLGDDWVKLYDETLNLETLQKAERDRSTMGFPNLLEFDPKQIGEQAKAFFKGLRSETVSS